VLAEEESAAAQALHAALDSERYFALLAELTAWRFDLPVTGSRKAGSALKYLQQAERTVRKRWAAVPDGPGRDTALHRVRKAAKRARYAAEVAEPAIGKPARRAMKELHRMQKILGARQDQVVAAAFLLRAASAAAERGEDTFTYGVLYERNATER
jgi:CHAD domain-containing protein